MFSPRTHTQTQLKNYLSAFFLLYRFKRMLR